MADEAIATQVIRVLKSLELLFENRLQEPQEGGTGLIISFCGFQTLRA
jgi:hypothetical protein